MTETPTKIELPILNYSAFTTTCKDCVFAQKWANHQTGCEFARIERFRIHGGVYQIQERWKRISELVDNNLILMDDVTLDDYNNNWGLARYKDGKYEGLVSTIAKEPQYREEKTFYEIPRYCDKCRNDKWAESHKGENLGAKVKEETKFNVSVALIINENSTLEQLTNSVANISEQTFKPLEIMVLNLGAKIERNSISELLKNCGIEHYRYIKPLVKDAEFGLLEIYRQARGKWIVEVHNHEPLNVHLIDKLNDALNERLERFVLWKFFPSIYAFQKKTLIEYSMEGLQQKAKDENQEFLIREGEI